jgi:hypothetical protein
MSSTPPDLVFFEAELRCKLLHIEFYSNILLVLCRLYCAVVRLRV